MSSARDFDMLAMARDLVCRDECERLFTEIHAEDKERERMLVVSAEYSGGYRDGLRFAMDVLDVRIGMLRDRWG